MDGWKDGWTSGWIQYTLIPPLGEGGIISNISSNIAGIISEGSYQTVLIIFRLIVSSMLCRYTKCHSIVAAICCISKDHRRDAYWWEQTARNTGGHFNLDLNRHIVVDHWKAATKVYTNYLCININCSAVCLEQTTQNWQRQLYKKILNTNRLISKYVPAIYIYIYFVWITLCGKHDRLSHQSRRWWLTGPPKSISSPYFLNKIINCFNEKVFRCLPGCLLDYM